MPRGRQQPWAKHGVTEPVMPRHLYLHVPFCARRCSYCDFAVDAVRDPPATAWLDAIELELGDRLRSEKWAEPLPLRTVYVGGGTPSLLGRGAMDELRRRLGRLVRWDDVAEWTAEANPETFGDALARDWRRAGIDRVSLGVQSFNAEALRWMGRLHGPEGPARAVGAARRAGIRNISVDLIFGLPSRLGRDWANDLDRALALEPSHVSLYGLTSEPATPLGRWVAEGRERMADDDQYGEEYLLATERLCAAGYEHYEVSNFAHPGARSQHNSAYWDGAAYLGLGPSAHSLLPPERSWNVRDWQAYRNALAGGGTAVADRETVAGEAAELERIWLGLRVSSGLPVSGLASLQRELVARWRSLGWAVDEAGRVRLTAAGWLLLDRLALELDRAGRKDVRRLDVARATGAHSVPPSYTEVDLTA
jgi:oxygen-independent coproporphyrinogen-3 oxidase